MGQVFSEIDDRLREFIEHQKMYFVGTAPLAADGRVNLSPKGFDSFRVLGPKTVGYLELFGSGIETMAHLKENGRIVIMFCAFDGGPKIVRLHGRGEAHEVGTPGFEELQPLFPIHKAARSIIRVHVERVADSCGFGVPFMDFVAERDTYEKFSRTITPEKAEAMKRESNLKSIDGLPGLAIPEASKVG